MKQLLSKCAILALITLCLSSCYYSSPVPLASEGKLPEKGLQGSWKMITDKDADATYTLNLYAQNEEGYNGDLTIEGMDEGEKRVEFYRLTVFITEIQGVGIVNIGLNMGEPDGEYIFGKYTWDGDKLSVFYVSEDLFTNEAGDVSHFTDISTFRAQFEELLKQGGIFEEKPAVFTRIE